ncbi:response regulator transcription factor [Chlorobium phaeovibrioides]|uniref:Response regulator transcription factor n=1 Tax=Chlorobium phaeovibrioides TaxID=1094 RepID=A0A432ATA1_CHLPH|nr:winged helix-turn-helix domain-containing protein [Chlorobium phaeovibrioides]RTY36296.1 response regulator transcription factor [Chlorobium phaeovibrioides]
MVSRYPSSTISSRRVVVVQSDPDARERLVAYLKKEGIDVFSVASALELYSLLSQEEFALAVIADDLADQRGLVVARFLKRNTSLSSIMLIGAVTPKARLAAYNAGALACFATPVECAEFSVLIGNLLEKGVAEGRGEAALASQLQFGGGEWKLLRNGWVLVGPGGAMVKLTIKEFEFMSILASSKEMAVPRSTLMEHMEYRNDIHGHKALEAVVHRLRMKAEKAGGQLIETAHGVGWGFSSVVTLV